MRWERWRGWVLAVAAGLCLALAMPGIGVAPLVLLVPGLLRRAFEGLSPRRAFLVGWVGGAAEWLVGVGWVLVVLTRYGGLGWPLSILALVLMSGILGLMWGLAGWLAARAPEGWRGWLLPLLLVCLEVVQHLPPWIFPWNPVAAVVTPWPGLLRPLPVLGTPGLSLVLLILGSGLDLLLVRARRREGAALAAGAVAAWVVAAWLAPGFQPAGESFTAAAVQPNVPLEERWDPANEEAIEARVWRLSSAAADAGAALVTWSESSIPRYVQQDGGYRVAIERFTRSRGVWLLLGSIGFGPAEGAYYNSVFVASPGGLLPYRYDKVHLVPFGEYLPLVGHLPFLKPLVREVSSFTPGTAALPLPGPGGPMGVAICYEVTYPWLYASEVERGAKLLVTITNDGWYGDSPAPRQHLALAILRAAETRRYLVRSANTGISAVIDPYGRVLRRLEVGREGFITAPVQPGTGVTLAVSWVLGSRLVLVLTACGAILCAVRRRSSTRL